MKRFHPSPALVISIVALFVALGGSSYAAITALPANSVGTKQLKNGAVSTAKLKASVLKNYIRVGSSLPSGMTEVGAWGFGTTSGSGGGADARPVFTFPVKLAAPIANAVAVTGASAAHCPGAGHADHGYLCVYENENSNAQAINDFNIYNPVNGNGSSSDKTGFAILLEPQTSGDWYISGTYAVTAP
jgi:hypothetical protein